MARPLYGADGTVQPPSEIVRRLRAVDPHLALRLNPSGRGWWLVREWGEREPRRAMIQRGEMPADGAWDLLCEIPLDCDVWQVPGYLQTLRRVNGKEDVQRMLDEMDRYNDALREDAIEAAIADTMERAEHRAERGFGALPRVFNAGIPETPRPLSTPEGRAAALAATAAFAPPGEAEAAAALRVFNAGIPEAPVATYRGRCGRCRGTDDLVGEGFCEFCTGEIGKAEIEEQGAALVEGNVRTVLPKIRALSAADALLLDAAEAAEQAKAEPRATVLHAIRQQRNDPPRDAE